MKRTLFTVIAVVFATSVALAQNPFEPLLKGYKVVNTTSEQGHDRLDSIYYLHTKTYVVPYKGGKNANRVNEVVSKIMDLYNGQLPNYTGGFCYSSNLQDSLTTESSRISAYYTEYQCKDSDHSVFLLILIVWLILGCLLLCSIIGQGHQLCRPTQAECLQPQLPYHLWCRVDGGATRSCMF